MTRIIFSTIIDYSFAAYKVIIFSLKVLYIDLTLERSGEVTFRAIGEGIHLLLVLGFPHPYHLELPPPFNLSNPIPLAHKLPPHWP